MTPEQLSANLRFLASRISARIPTRETMASELRRVVANLEQTGADQKQVEQALYGRTKPFSTAEDTPPEEAAGSSLYWSAFEELDMVDWTPVTDPEPVFAKTKEIAERLKAQGLHVDPARAEKEARKNWESYKTHYMAGHQKKLQELGLLTEAEGVEES